MIKKILSKIFNKHKTSTEYIEELKCVGGEK